VENKENINTLMERKHTFTANTKQKVSQKINGLLGVWVGISFSGLLIWNGIVGMPSQLSNCTVPYPGSEAVISLKVGDTLCIPAGETFKGKIESFPKGSQIRVSQHAIFDPIAFWDAKGSIENQGLFIMQNLLNADGLKIDNKGKIDVQQVPGTDANLSVLNRRDADIRFLSTVDHLDAKLNLQNYGNLYIESDFRMGKNCMIENNGKLVMQGTFVTDGRISNFGIVHSYENILLGKNANINNQCSFIAPNIDKITHPGFSNSGSILTTASNKLEAALKNPQCASRFQASNPIILQFFSSKFEKNLPVLKWQVEKGSNASSFELERSFDNSNFEGINFQEVSEDQDRIFKLSDKDLAASSSNVVYYRLRMTNTQGKVNYSPVIQMALNESLSRDVH